jgi:hypothetical protein
MDIDTHSEYVILIDFPLQQWLHEPASLLRHTYIVCVVNQTVSVKVRGSVNELLTLQPEGRGLIQGDTKKREFFKYVVAAMYSWQYCGTGTLSYRQPRHLSSSSSS